MTEQEKQELVEHCEKAIAGAEQNIEAFKKLGNDSHGVIALLNKEVKVYQIALASLKAQPELWEIENPGEGTFYTPHGPREFEEVRTEWFTNPPASKTLEIKMPEPLFEHKSGLFGHSPTLTLQTAEWADGYREAIMDVTLLNEVK